MATDADADADTDDDTSSDLIALLEADHRRITRLLDEGVFGEDLALEVATHLSAETQLLYREMRNEVPDDDLISLCLEVDHQLEQAAADVGEGDGSARERAAAAFDVHVQLQEGRAFPALRQYVGEDRLLKLGGAVEAVVRMAPRRPHPHGPDEGASNVFTEFVGGAVDQFEDYLSRLFHKH